MAASASTLGTNPPDIPLPSADHVLPSHLAIAFALTPPALPNLRPAYRSVPIAARVSTPQSIPSPRADQVLPLHLAMYEAPTPPAVLNSPTAYSSASTIA